MLGRFELLLALRNQVADRALVRRALVVEAIMEELATALAADAALWGLAGLGAEIDQQLVAANPERRGALAEELLLTEGVPAEAAAAVRRFRGAAVAELPPIAQALLVADALADVLAEEDDARAAAHLLRKRARRGDPRPGQALAALGLEAERAVELAVVAKGRAGP